MTVADTIKSITRAHLRGGNGLLLGQCVSAVGWVGGTVPDDCPEGIIELPTTDVAGMGFACGVALAGRRPVVVVRYQGFMWLNASSLVNYAARSKAVWGVPCPVFVRGIGMEGNGVGHTASGCLHSLFMHVPGMKVAAPMAPKEYQAVWDDFMAGDDPMYCSEHRRSFQLEEMTSVAFDSATPSVTLFGISAGRLGMIDAVKTLSQRRVFADVFHIVSLKPFTIPIGAVESLRRSQLGLVIDSDFTTCGAAEHIAHCLMLKSGVPVHAMGIEDRVCGASTMTENVTPDAAAIIRKVKNLLA